MSERKKNKLKQINEMVTLQAAAAAAAKNNNSVNLFNLA